MAAPQRTPRRAATRKPKQRVARRTTSGRLAWLRLGLSLTLLLVIALVAAVVAKHWLQPPASGHAGASAQPNGRTELRQPLPPLTAPLRRGPEAEGRTELQLAVPTPPTFEIYPKRDTPRSPPPKAAVPKSGGLLPLVAIIIDDIGYDRALAERMMGLHGALTFSFFPDSPFVEPLLKTARSRGIDIMLHLPMEPMEYPQVDPGPGALLTSMEPAHLIAQLNAQLDALPEAKGVNNHMGSRLTADEARMRQILSVLHRRGLYFVDSRTSSDSASRKAARASGVAFAERDVFLDHRQHPEFIRQQVRTLIKDAQRHGAAIGIAHPHEVTYEVLREMLPELQRQVRLVPAARLARPMG